MFFYLLKRILYTLPAIWLVATVVFFMIHIVPGDPIQQMLGEGAASADVEAAPSKSPPDSPPSRGCRA
jgi:ABC-type dipeptide/oligopeptide/nickel transport system permease component